MYPAQTKQKCTKSYHELRLNFDSITYDILLYDKMVLISINVILDVKGGIFVF